MTVSLINPLDICYMTIRNFAESEGDKAILSHGKTEVANLDTALELPTGVGRDEFFAQYCPPLPANFKPQKDESKAIGTMLDARSFRISARNKYTKEQWRMHRWLIRVLPKRLMDKYKLYLMPYKRAGKRKIRL